jgi:hypothetical protein
VEAARDVKNRTSIFSTIFRSPSEYVSPVPELTGDCGNEMMITKPLLTRKQLAEELRSAGYPIGTSTLVKLCCNGEGPEVSAYWGKRPLYHLDDGIAWAAARLRPATAAA